MIWFVRRRADSSICYASEEWALEGDEPLDDATSAEMRAFRALVTAPPAPATGAGAGVSADDLTAALVAKGLLKVADLPARAQAAAAAAVATIALEDGPAVGVRL